MTFFRRERQLTALIRSADPVAAKPAHKFRYTPLWAVCALLVVVWCRLPAPSAHLPAPSAHLPAAETATLFPRSLAGSLGIHPPGGTTADPLRLIARASLRIHPPAAETATPFGFSLVPRCEGGQNWNSLSNPLPDNSPSLARAGVSKKGKRVARNEPGDGQPRRHAKPLRKRARRAPALLVASEPHAPEPQGGMIVIAVRPMTPEELHQELNTP